MEMVFNLERVLLSIWRGAREASGGNVPPRSVFLPLPGGRDETQTLALVTLPGLLKERHVALVLKSPAQDPGTASFGVPIIQLDLIHLKKKGH